MSPVERTSGGGGGGGLTSPLTTKGDVWGWSTTNARIPVGVDHQVLTAASGQTLGVDYEYPPGYELDYVEATSSLTVTATTEGTAQTFITGNAVTYDGSTRVKIEFTVVNVDMVSGTGVISLFLDGATTGWIMEQGNSTASDFGGTVYTATFQTPSAGSHTYTIRAWKTAGTFVLTAKPRATKQEQPAWYRITRA